MHRTNKIPLVLLNPLVTCRLCDGYLIDATTIVECLHSFCRSCLLKYLEQHTTCPICDTLLHKTKPHYAIRSDRSLQAIVYKLIPKLFETEMAQRKLFYKDCSETEYIRSLSPERRGEITLSSYIIQEDEYISIELVFWHPNDDAAPPVHKENGNKTKELPGPKSIYLLCPSEVTVAHLEKLIRTKFSLEPNHHNVLLFFSSDDLFSPEYTLSDLACLYSWRRIQPMKLFFTVLEQSRQDGQAKHLQATSEPFSNIQPTRSIASSIPHLSDSFTKSDIAPTNRVLKSSDSISKRDTNVSLVHNVNSVPISNT